MNNYITAYFNNFRGFSREIWVLAAVTYINRAGAMVMPFLANYMLKSFSFTFEEVGWMMACIGCGSFAGSWIGGKLTDKIGFYTIMLLSLIMVGFGFISLMFLYSFQEFCIGLFLISTIADMYKPAMYVAVGSFSTTENRTRALSLVRLAVNLGMVSGPIFGGLIVSTGNYDYLFWIDGLTCIVAIMIFMILIDENKLKKEIKVKSEASTNDLKIFSDSNYVVFLLASFATAFMFFQLTTTIPAFNSKQFHLDEVQLGMVLALNAVIIFIFEMPMISYFESRKRKPTNVIFLGSFFMAAGFIVLMFAQWLAIVILSIILITVGQILIFSFSNTFALSRAKIGFEGRYMALYSMSFSVAQILSAKVGFAMIGKFNFTANWALMSVVGLIAIAFYFLLNKKITSETNLTNIKIS